MCGSGTAKRRYVTLNSVTVSDLPCIFLNVDLLLPECIEAILQLGDLLLPVEAVLGYHHRRHGQRLGQRNQRPGNVKF